MKKIILPVIVFVFLLLVFPSGVYAEPEETTSSPKSSSGYDPKCWNTHMNGDIAVCSRASLDCMNPFTKKDLKANALCLGACSKTHQACLKSASAAYKVCIEAEKQAQKKQEIKQFKPTQVSAPQQQSTQDFTDWVVNTFGVFDPDKIEIVSDVSDQAQQRPPKLTKKNEAELLELSKKVSQRSPYWVGFIRMETDEQPLIKYPGTDEFVPFGSLSEIKPGSIIRSGNNQIAIVDDRDDRTIYINQDSEVTIFDEERDGMPLLLQKGEIEIKEEQGGNSMQGAGIQTDFFDLIVIGTHFWVLKDPATKQATVGVYEGEVQIKTKDGQSVAVVPDNDLPGVVMVSKKLSPLKLALAGLVLVVVISGIIFIIRKKLTSKGFSKKKR